MNERLTLLRTVACVCSCALDLPLGFGPESIVKNPWDKPKYGHGKNGGYRHSTKVSQQDSGRYRKTNHGCMKKRKGASR